MATDPLIIARAFSDLFESLKGEPDQDWLHTIVHRDLPITYGLIVDGLAALTREAERAADEAFGNEVIEQARASRRADFA